MAKTKFSPEINPDWFRGGRASPKSLYLSDSKPREKSNREKQKAELKWLWFEEASEFENWKREGDKT